MEEDRMLKWFAWAHLPEHLQVVSQPFGDLAATVCREIKPGPERTVAIEAVRNAVAARREG